MGKQAINGNRGRAEQRPEGPVSAADGSYRAGRSFMDGLTRQLRHDFETLRAQDRRRRDLEALQAQDREHQEVARQIVAGTVQDRVERISEHLDRLSGRLAAMEHPEQWRLAGELAAIERHLAGMHPEGERHPAGDRNRSGDPPGASGGHAEAGRGSRDMPEPGDLPSPEL